MSNKPKYVETHDGNGVVQPLRLSGSRLSDAPGPVRTTGLGARLTTPFLQAISGSAFSSGTARYAQLLSQMWHAIHGTPIETIALSRHLPSGLPRRGQILVHLGTNDGLTFNFCREVSRTRPDLRLLMLMHDPPHFPHSKRLWMESLAGTRIGRGLRAVANRLWSDYFDSDLCAIGDHWIVMSQAGREALRERLSALGRPHAPVTVIPHGMYEECMLPERHSSSGALKLGFFGHITPTKGLHVVVEALGELTRAGFRQAVPRLIVAGAPDSAHSARYLQGVEQQVRRLGLQDVISFRGHLAEHELPAFFEQIDALVLPYLRPSSSSASGPLHLALTYGRPVVCSRSPYFDEAVARTGIGYVAAAGSVTEWSDLLRRISATPDKLGELTEAIAAARSSHSWKHIAECYTQLVASPLLYRCE